MKTASLTPREILEQCVTAHPYDSFYGFEKQARKAHFGRRLGAGVSRATWDLYWAPFKRALDVLHCAAPNGSIVALRAQDVATAIDLLEKDL